MDLYGALQVSETILTDGADGFRQSRSWRNTDLASGQGARSGRKQWGRYVAVRARLALLVLSCSTDYPACRHFGDERASQVAGLRTFSPQRVDA